MAFDFSTPAAAVEHVTTGPNYRLPVADTLRHWSTSRKATHATLEDALAALATIGSIVGVQVSKYGADDGILVDLNVNGQLETYDIYPA